MLAWASSDDPRIFFSAFRFSYVFDGFTLLLPEVANLLKFGF